MPSDLNVPGGFDLTSIAPDNTRTLRCWCYPSATTRIWVTPEGIFEWDRTTPEVPWDEANVIIFEPLDRQGNLITGAGMIDCGDMVCSQWYGGVSSPIQLLRQVIAA